MYGWLWRSLPGGTGARTLQFAAITVITLALLWFWVFPWASDSLSAWDFSP
jgi:hypothetical protein